MSKYVNILITMMCINLLLVLGQVIPPTTPISQGNFISPFFNMASSNSDPTVNPQFQNVVGDVPNQGAGSTTGLGFIDGIKLLLGLFGYILSTVSAPFQLVFNSNLNLPFVFRIMVGLPLMIIYIFSLIGFLRGNE